MEEKNDEFTSFLEDHDWTSKFAYLANIFQHFNLVNFGLQGTLENVLTTTVKLSVIQEKISVCCINLDRGNTAIFSLFTGQENSNLEVLRTIRSHLWTLQMSLKFYLLDLNVKQNDWVRHSFTSLVQTDDCKIQKKTVKLKEDRTLQLKLKIVSLNSFWVSLHSD